MRTTNSFKKKITPNKKPGKAKAQNHNEIPDKKRGEKTKIPIKAERPSTSSGSSRNTFKKKKAPNKKSGKARAQKHGEIPDKKRGEKSKISIKAERPSTSSGSSNPLKKPLVRKTPLCQQYLNS